MPVSKHAGTAPQAQKTAPMGSALPDAGKGFVPSVGPLLTPAGAGLVRPECVLAHQSGLLFAADWTGSGGVAIIQPATNPDHVAWVEHAYVANELGRPHLDSAKGKRLCNLSSLAFGGADLKTAYLGCLLGETIFSFAAPVAGEEPVHYRFDPGPLSKLGGGTQP